MSNLMYCKQDSNIIKNMKNIKNIINIKNRNKMEKTKRDEENTIYYIKERNTSRSIINNSKKNNYTNINNGIEEVKSLPLKPEKRKFFLLEFPPKENEIITKFKLHQIEFSRKNNFRGKSVMKEEKPIKKIKIIKQKYYKKDYPCSSDFNNDLFINNSLFAMRNSKA